MIIDVSFFNEFYHAEQLKTYKDLIDYMVQFTHEFYIKHNILVEEFSITPQFETELITETIWLPIQLKFKAYILRAEENIIYRTYNYTEAWKIYLRYSKQYFPSNDLKNAEKYYKPWLKAKNYERQYGPKRAKIIKQKISNSMSNLSKEIIEKRNKSICKKVLCIETCKIYDSAKQAAEDNLLSISSIRNSCKTRKKVKNLHFQYIA